MHIFSKLVISAFIISSACQAVDTKNMKTYIQDAVASQGGKAENIQFMPRKTVPNSGGWEMVQFSFDVVADGKKTPVNDVLYTYGEFIAPDIINAKMQVSAKELFLKQPDQTFYIKENILAGNANAKNSVLVFSDPLCPNCKDVLLDLLKVANKTPDKLSVYLYHFPLTKIHPSSPALIKAMIFLKTKGYNVAPLVYSYNFKNIADEKKALGELNTLLRVNGINVQVGQKDIKRPEIVRKYNFEQTKAKELSISFTPSIYTNGKHDHAQKQYRQIKASIQ